LAENKFIERPLVEEQKPKENKKKKSKSEDEPGEAKPKLSMPPFFKDRRFVFLVGVFFVVISMVLLFSFISHLFEGKEDYSLVFDDSITLAQAGEQSKNQGGFTGSVISHYFINQWFGLGSFLLIPVIFLLGLALVLGKTLPNQIRFSKAAVFSGVWISLLTGFIVSNLANPGELIYLCGGTGYYIANCLNGLMGWATFLLLFFVLLVFFIYFLDLGHYFGLPKSNATLEQEQLIEKPIAETNLSKATFTESLEEDEEVFKEIERPVFPISQPLDLSFDTLDTSDFNDEELEDEPMSKATGLTSTKENLGGDFEVEHHEEQIANLSATSSLGTYDPTLDLSKYKYPTIDLLIDAPESKVQVTKEELEANKNKIVETLGNYKIGIASIKATIGPTVTLYEIIPEAGVKISKIKSLEDDIALSLAALGIRIIAPIPGKGTIGIEVPNTVREMVSFRSLLMTEKFVQSKMALPVVMGKTITNEVFMIDLAKMPHVLMAGATGQGKSVGLNIILASLLYKKHPAQLKFVLVDPKKVELSVFSKIERHFLAKLPNEEEAIITDTSKVINTLNSLCIEMDNRYDLLKLAGCRNLKEYNTKFTERNLNPEKGHYFMPYIVLVIDELADLMMTAGKEVETPIARLAQLARAIGIHLVVATQRPSVNVITGIIKANFPARISFKVTSKIDSRTILDAGGADQLIGQGDMLFSQGSETIRVQCGFVDTPEIENIVDFIGEQQGYSSAYNLPEYVGEGGDEQSSSVDLSNRDAMFDEAARLIVQNQQGSTSLIQRKLKLGYNRAGRIVDQLEAAGVVGPFQGAKARDVYIQDEGTLEQLLRDLNNR
jgi:DNA segregation ATPase FtsK/SpoIIIE, S-DNA-T family